MQQEPNFTNHMMDHIANRQRPRGVPKHLLDQVDAAAFDGARAVDASAAARESGDIAKRPATTADLVNRIEERHGDPLTDLQECIHLAVTPIQRRYVFGGTLERVLCEKCFRALSDDASGAIHTFASSYECAACGSEIRTGILGVAMLSNGMVTYAGAKICSDCTPIEVLTG
jgi:hypothetical protein